MDVAETRTITRGTFVGRADARTIGWAIATCAVVGLGVALRLAQWAHGRSLWLDESMLALNLIDRSYLELFGELELMQAAPPGFLVAEKLAADFFGYGTYVLRLMPLVAGLASLVVFARLSREFVTGVGRFVALLIVALSPPLVFYSAELKQYSLDVLAIVVVVLLTLMFRTRPLDARRLATLSLAGFAIVWISYASVFALAALLCALAVDAATRSDWRRVGRLLVPATVWVTGFGIAYLLTRPNLDPIRESLAWASAYPDGVKWYASQSAQLGYFLFGGPGVWGKAIVALAGALAVAGAFALGRDDPFKATLLVIPLVGVMAAATLDLYPFGGRFVLFTLPVLALLIGRGVTAVGSWAPNAMRSTVAFGLAAAISVLLLVEGAPYLVSPSEREEVRPVLEYVREQWRQGDVLYVHAASQHAARYYAEVYETNFRDGRVLWRVAPAPGGSRASLLSQPPELVVGRSESAAEFRADLGRLSGRGRVWFVFSHVFRFEEGRFVDDLPAHIALLDRAGDRLDEFHRTGADAYLVDVRTAPAS